MRNDILIHILCRHQDRFTIPIKVFSIFNMDKYMFFITGNLRVFFHLGTVIIIIDYANILDVCVEIIRVAEIAAKMRF